MRVLQSYILVLLINVLSATNENSTQSQCQPCFCEEKRNVVIANCRNMHGLNYLPEFNKDVQVIYFEDQSLNSLEENYFKHYGKLTALYLQNNEIKYVDEGCLKNLSNMKICDLSKNMLNRIQPIFRDTPNIVEIFLNNNEIIILEENLFSNLQHLEKLHLQYNKIHAVEESCFVNLPSIYLINLNSNRIETLPDSIIGNLSNLKLFDLENNPWNCDERTCKFREYSLEKNWKISMPHCVTPENVKGKTWRELKNDTVLIIANETVVDEGQNVTFTCEYLACIPFKLMWKSNKNEILTNITSSSNNKFIAILQLNNVSSTDEMTYSCRVEDCRVCKEGEVYLRVNRIKNESTNTFLVTTIVVMAVVLLTVVVLVGRPYYRKYLCKNNQKLNISCLAPDERNQVEEETSLNGNK